MTRRRFWLTVAAIWAFTSFLLVVVGWGGITKLWFPDPDDAMRLSEVRDWLGGQSWWDVGQHRLYGGHFAMHWSRLVDLPIAAVMLICDPLFGNAASTRIAMTAVPLITLFCTMALAALLTWRLVGIERAWRAVMLAALSIPIVSQMRPMRIDHHGWQIVLALGAAAALVSTPNRRSGLLAGLSLGTLVTISLEGLPITAGIAAIAILAAVVDPRRRDQTIALLWSLLGSVVVYQIITRGPAMLAPACDAIAPVWIAALAIAIIGATAALLAPRTVSLVVRLAILGGTAIIAITSLRLAAPVCLKGPFATLDPLVYRIWYLNVAEGMPFWRQPWPVVAIMAGFPIVGVIGTVMALRASHGGERLRWAIMLALLIIAFTLALLVMRAGGTANAFALPGGAWLLEMMLRRAERVRSKVKQASATAGALIVATPGLIAGIAFGDIAPVQSKPLPVEPGTGIVRQSCVSGHEMADLAALPPSTIFAPLDVTPSLIAWSHHRAIASGYHRNPAAIHTVLATFLGTPEAAQDAVFASGAAYVAGCPGENETEIYKHEAPDGFWARLERGDRFDWLQPVTIPHSPVLVWRVIAPQHRLPPGPRQP